MGEFSDVIQHWLTGGIHTNVLNEVRQSGLQGAGDGPADAYRHILRAAEMTRQGMSFTKPFLWSRELLSTTDSAMDHYNNNIGYAIGEYVKQKGGSWEDIKKLSRAAMDKMLSEVDSASIQEGNGFTKHKEGFLTRGKLELAEGFKIDSPAIFPSSRWYHPPIISKEVPALCGDKTEGEPPLKPSDTPFVNPCYRPTPSR